MSLVGAAVGALADSAPVAAGPAQVATVSDDDWLGVVNAYRAMSGLARVNERVDWSTGTQLHSCYMLANGLTHDEVPGRARYTTEGDVAGNSSNVALSSSTLSTARDHIQLWMTGPFHAIGLLRRNLGESAFGLCEDEAGSPWRSAATLDVIRGLGPAKPATEPVVFPGPGSTVPLHSFITETPNPMPMCNWTGRAGLPLVVLMPHLVSRAAATLVGPNGPIETCVLHQGNVSDPTAQAILAGDNAVVVMPRAALADGAYSVSVSSDGGRADWGFSVDRSATLVDPARVVERDTAVISPGSGFGAVAQRRVVDTRIGLGSQRMLAGGVVAVKVAAPDVAAVSAAVAAVDPDGPGYLTVFACGSDTPAVSTLNYGANGVVSNLAVIPLRHGEMCMTSRVATDVVVDITGEFLVGASLGFVAEPPTRVLDTRPARRLLAGSVVPVQVGVDPGTRAVALNATVVGPAGPGWLRVFPCGTDPGASGAVSLNYDAVGDVRASAVVSEVGASGNVCIQSLVDVDVVIDRTGRFATGGTLFTTLDPIRLLDSRLASGPVSATGGVRLRPDVPLVLQVSGVRGVPNGAKAAALNITALAADEPGYVTAYPCGAIPPTSTVNLVPWRHVAANAAMVALSQSGQVCLIGSTAAHVLVDISGVWI